jgi:hypothetical protein
MPRGLPKTSLIGILVDQAQEKLSINKCNGQDCSDEDDDFELEICPKASADKIESYTKRGYHLLGYETEEVQGTKFLKFLRLQQPDSLEWDKVSKNIPHQYTYEDKCIENNNERTSLPSTWNESKFDDDHPRFDEENKKRRTRIQPDEAFEEYRDTRYGLQTRKDSSTDEDHFIVKKINFYTNSSHWPTEQTNNLSKDDTGGLGGVPYYFEKLGINVGEGKEGSSSNSIHESAQIHIRMKDNFEEFTASKVTTHITPGGADLEGGSQELEPIKEGDSIVEINGITIKSHLPIRFKGKGKNWVIKGGVSAVAGLNSPPYAAKFTSKTDDDAMVACAEGFNQDKGRTLLDVDQCDYCQDKDSTRLADAIKVSEYKND